MSAATTPDLRIGAMDRALAVLARWSSGWFHLVADLEPGPDLEALAEAWRRLVARHPTLRAGARFEDDPAEWTLHPQAPPLKLSDDPTATGALAGPAELTLLRADPRPGSGPLARLTAVRRADGLRLVASSHHVLHDAASGVALFGELAGHYRAVRAGVAAPDDVDARPRVVEDLLAARMSRWAHAAAVSRAGARWWEIGTSTHVDPAEPGVAGGYAAVDVGVAMAAIGEVRRRRRWRTSAILWGLLARAWDQAFPGAGSDVNSTWQFSSDLRTELGVGMAAGLGNFSSTEPVRLTGVTSRSVEEVVADAHRTVAGISSGWPGLAVPVAISGVEVPWSLFAATADAALDRVAALRCTRSFSNVGATPPEAADWGDCAVRRLFYAPAMTTMPWVTVAAQGLGGSMWLSMRTHERGVDAAGVERLGEALVADADALAGAPVRRAR